MRNINWSLDLSVESTQLPLTLGELRDHSRITDRASDQHLMATLLAATRYCETVQKRKYVLATYILRMDLFPGVIVLPKPPLSSVTSIQYVDSSGNTQTLDDSKYQADLTGDPGRIMPAFGVGAWPVIRSVFNAVTVTYVAGYANQIQETRVTPTAVAVDDVFNIKVDGVVVATFTATEATVANVTAGLQASFSVPGVTATDESTYVKLVSGTAGVPFSVTTGPTDGGSVDAQELPVTTITPAQAVPQSVKHAIRLLVEHWDVNREPIVVGTINQGLAFTVRDLLAGEKVFRF